MANFYDNVVELLKQDTRFITEDGTLLRNAVYEAAMQMDENLIRLLLSTEETKKHFFKNVDEVLVFDKIVFGWVVNNRQFLPDSYTRFKNKIGLADDNGNLLSSSGNVELVFPYKDCVLEGGQTKEDQKRKEIFYNETLAPDEVDRLLYPKVLTNQKRYSSDGITPVINLDEKDNLIIRGNNILALSSLLKRYENKVKCIYIDPPFNTGDDEFKYNDSFNHSTWLVFMRNRLCIAKKLLKHNGIMVVNIGNEEVSYIQILLDEIFGRNNFINHITMSTNDPSGFKATGSKIFSTSNHLFIYGKSNESTINKLYLEKEYDTNYKYVITNFAESYDKWKYITIADALCEEFKITKNEFKKQYSKTQQYELISDFANKNKFRVFRTAAIGGGALAKRKDTIAISKNNKGKVYVHPNEDVENFYILNGENIVFWGNLFRKIDGNYVATTALTDVWTDISWTGISSEGGVKLKNGKKPEKLIKRILELATEKEDIVLDYHLGSGTTCAVAAKMGRRFIGIEQLDYGVNDGVERLKNVIHNDQSGISKTVGWQGGGSFVYCELAKSNQSFVDEIEAVTSDDEIINIYNRIIETGFISSKVNPKEIDVNADDFTTLSLEDKKHFLMELLDKNLLYINYCDIDDEEYAISDEDKAFTRSFYGEV